MNIDEFTGSLSEVSPPVNLSELLNALWYEAKGDWNRAHRIVQAIETVEASWIHAHLHRKEGDLDNARYWYRRAGRPETGQSLTSEWEELVLHLLRTGPWNSSYANPGSPE